MLTPENLSEFVLLRQASLAQGEGTLTLTAPLRARYLRSGYTI